MTTTARSIYALVASLMLPGVALLLPASGQSVKPPEGQRLFAQRCAPCHGKMGEGGSAYPKALTGSLSVAELGKFIKQSMPPGRTKCPASDADKIAPYIYDAFYSPLAQERIRPARVALVRLTVKQFRNAVADLVGPYHSAVPSDKAEGLHAEYFKGRNIDSKERAFQRTDPQVAFDFGNRAPSEKDIDPYSFSALWDGSVLAPDSGDYEFVVQSDQAIRLWVNDDRTPLIDGFVRSSTQKEFRASLPLLGGRAYHIRLEFSKATQGVDDKKKKTTPVPKASIFLRWRRPNHAEELIPTFCMYPQWSPKTFVVTTPFPPDDRSTGFERGNAITKDWDDATTAASIETAEYIVHNLKAVTDVSEDTKNRSDRLKDYCRSFVASAFRRPLTPEIEQIYIDKQFKLSPDPETAVKRVVVLTLNSPQFLYREIAPSKPDGFTVASQLSFALWDTIPGPELEQAASRGDLATADKAMGWADRMSNDFRTWNKLREFLFKWFKLDEVPDIVKNSKDYPGFDQTVVSDLRTSFELFLQNTAWSASSDYRGLMLSKAEFLNGNLAQIYGVVLPANATFQPVQLDQDARAGAITQPYLLARWAYLDASDPIHRGVLIFRNLLGRIIKPPPANFVPLAASAHPEMTTRERVSLQTKPPFCAGCHGIMNPLGYTLEEFDAIGRLRKTDNSKPVDCSGSYRAKNGSLATFSDANDLANYLANSDDAHSAFIEKLFVHEVKQPPMAYGTTTLADLQQAFAKSQYSIRSLLVQIAVATAFQGSNRGTSKGTPTK